MSAITHEPRNRWKNSAMATRASRQTAALPVASAFLRKTAVKGERLLTHASGAFAEAADAAGPDRGPALPQPLYPRVQERRRTARCRTGASGAARAIVFPRVVLERAAGAVVDIAKRIYPAIIVPSLVAAALAATMALRLAIWLPLYWH